MPNVREIFRKRLEGKTRYEFCPFCIKPFLAKNEDYRSEVPPLFLIKTEEYIPDLDKYWEEKYWLCPKCQKRIDEKMMEYFYCCRFDRTRFYTNSKPFLRKMKGSDEMEKVFISKEDQKVYVCQE